MWYRYNTNAVCRKETSHILNLCLKVNFAGSIVSVIMLRIWCMVWTCTVQSLSSYQLAVYGRLGFDIAFTCV